jgi:hypothetical protein
MFIFRIEMHKKSWATLEVNFPCHRITLRAKPHLVAATRLVANPRLSLADLTLPLVNPPTNQGQPNYFLPSSRGMDRGGTGTFLTKPDHAGCVRSSTEGTEESNAARIRMDAQF